jgi:hypothetical protein
MVEFILILDEAYGREGGGGRRGAGMHGTEILTSQIHGECQNVLFEKVGGAPKY